MKPLGFFSRSLSQLGTLLSALTKAWVRLQTRRAIYRLNTRALRWVDVVPFEPSVIDWHPPLHPCLSRLVPLGAKRPSHTPEHEGSEESEDREQDLAEAGSVDSFSDCRASPETCN